MTLLTLFFSIGIICAAYFPFLPSPGLVLCVAFASGSLALVLHKKVSQLIWLSAFVLGVSYGLMCGHHMLANQLSETLAGQDILVEGRVVDLPQEDSRRQLFGFRVSKAQTPSGTLIDSFPAKINLSSYDSLRVKTGEGWRLLVKLKVPRGFANPGGFDFQASLMRRSIGATGYIRASGSNQLLHQQPRFSMDVLRYQLQQWLINTSRSAEKGILVALLVGDTSLVDKDHWSEMLKTGTNHLIAISGLHIGFFAIIGFLVGNFIGRFAQLLWHKCPSLNIGYSCALAFALFYSLIAGMNIPTLRTLIMLAVVQWVYLWRRSFRGRDTLLLALVLVLLVDPLASFDMGFWLSFSAVSMLIFCFSGRIPASQNNNFLHSVRRYLREFTKSQWVMFIGLLVPLAVLVHTSSMLAPPANIVAIPVITFFVVPCLILAAVSHFLCSATEHWFLNGAELGMEFVHRWLALLLKWGAGQFNPVININPAALVLAAASVLLILLPPGLGKKYLGIAGLVLALLIPQQKLPALEFMVFDVGQGTATFIRTPHHELIYDTGPLYTENFDAGSGILVPYLQGQGLRELDAVIVSHNDQDHSGGLPGLLAATTTTHLWLGEPDKYRNTNSAIKPKSCHEILPWNWDGVNFKFITWKQTTAAKANNHSCVLLVTYQQHSILLTGDIEKEVEWELLANGSLSPVEVLLAPHHGSHTSSTQGFVDQTQPHWVIYSAGYHNQHGHPHKDVQARYEKAGAIPLNTADTGALELSWDASGVMHLVRDREFHKRYWFAPQASESAHLHDKN